MTICTHEQESFFGEIIENEMHLTAIGHIAFQCWTEIPNYYSFAKLDVFVIMPNHVHGIIIIDKEKLSPFNPENKFQPQSQNLASILRGYKAGVSRQAKQINADFRWQARFHDYIIRTDESYMRITDYILNNPIHWNKDKFYR